MRKLTVEKTGDPALPWWVRETDRQNHVIAMFRHEADAQMFVRIARNTLRPD